MKIHEYQAKSLMEEYLIQVPQGDVAQNVDEACAIADKTKAFPVVLKAQIHAGGRGKGGGIKIASNMEAVRKEADDLLGSTLVTPQTGPQGKVVRKILVEKGCSVREELYVSLLPDRKTAEITILASLAGGMNIEEVSAASPEKIVKVRINPLLGINAFHCRKVTHGLGLEGTILKQCHQLLLNLYRLFVECDCSLVEINPLVITDKNELIALDAKITFDDNALFRHKKLMDLRDTDEEHPLEEEASRYNLNYISLDGNVGNMVNGAGLAMATMDLIKQAGAEPANFLDVGGGADSEMVENGFRIILQDKRVKAILINIFGGILRCDVLAQGVVQAVKKCAVSVPVVVRMEGTNVDKGKKILEESKLNLISAVDLKDATRRIAEAIR